LLSSILNLPSSTFQREAHRLMALGGKVGGQSYFHDLPRMLGRNQHGTVKGHGLDKVDGFRFHRSLIDVRHLLARHRGERKDHAFIHCVEYDIPVTVVDQQSTFSSHNFDCCC
jgi:hypothetical protein